MPGDQIYRLAMMRIIKASAEIEAELRADIKGSGPVLEILRRLRDRAAESMEKLVFTDAQDTKAILTWQNEVKRYDEWVEWVREIIREGIEINNRLDDEEREEMIDMLLATPEGERAAIDQGLIDEAPRDA